ncbi:MAG: Deoxyribose-phosphate aldolase [Methanocella sp. PtaU1.Bin125]|nr:MAG: Deoxyribose-phosphate aldolase [Methanocella sp. PtaU1.Bin125]
MLRPDDVAALIDHTLLRPDATADNIRRLCEETAQYRFASACVASCWASFAREELDRLGATDIPVCSVVGFPFGSASTWAKVQETKAAVGDGAGEIDAVINVGFLRSGLADLARLDVEGVVDAAAGATVKIIIETCYLTDARKVEAGRIVRDAGADFVKTSTGYGPSGARLEDVALLKREVPGIKIKASGGIRTFEQAWALVEAGASRIGASAGPSIVRGARADGKR